MISQELREKFIELACCAIEAAQMPLGDPDKVCFSENDGDLYGTRLCRNSDGFDWAFGASKFVIIPHKEEYVIKIPFNKGIISFEAWFEAHYPEDNCLSSEEQDALYEEYCYLITSDYSSMLFDLQGACDTFTNSHIGWDYCHKESNVYLAAEEAGVGMFFAQTELLFYYNGYPVYIQPRCIGSWDTDFNSVASHAEQKSIREKLSYYPNIRRNVFDYAWAVWAEKVYGSDALLNFYEFIEDYDITDICGNNYGTFMDEKPCLIDYCGYAS